MTLKPRWHLDDCIFGAVVVAAFAIVVGMDAAVFDGATLGRDARSASSARAASAEGVTNTTAFAPNARSAQGARG